MTPGAKLYLFVLLLAAAVVGGLERYPRSFRGFGRRDIARVARTAPVLERKSIETVADFPVVSWISRSVRVEESFCTPESISALPAATPRSERTTGSAVPNDPVVLLRFQSTAFSERLSVAPALTWIEPVSAEAPKRVIEMSATAMAL